MGNLATQRTGQIGVNVVEGVVLREWKSRWQQIDSVNDDGIDGLIFVESRGTPTGQIIHVQVKCQKAKTDAQGRIRIGIKKEKLKRNMERWRRVVGAAILVHVAPDTLSAHWVDLRSPQAVVGTQVFVPLANTFDKNALAPITKMCGTIHRDLLLRRVRTANADFDYLTERTHIQTAARTFYRGLAAADLHLLESCPPCCHHLRCVEE